MTFHENILPNSSLRFIILIVLNDKQSGPSLFLVVSNENIRIFLILDYVFSFRALVHIIKNTKFRQNYNNTDVNMNNLLKMLYLL